jgi:hypothetical protein
MSALIAVDVEGAHRLLRYVRVLTITGFELGCRPHACLRSCGTTQNQKPLRPAAALAVYEGSCAS